MNKCSVFKTTLTYSKMNINVLNPDMSGPVVIDDVEWSSVTNFLYASLVDCNNPHVLEKFRTMPVEELRGATKEAMESDMQKIADAALEVAYNEKFADPDLKQALLKTGTVKLKTPRLFSVTNLSSAPLDEATELMKCRARLAENLRKRNAERDEQAYIRRVKQAFRITKAMTKILYEGNSLERFKHFSIASIPTELAHAGDAATDSIAHIPPEIKSAALALNGNILYNFVRRKELRKYRNEMDTLKGSVAKACVATYLLNSKYPHFYKEAVSKHTGDHKSEINSIRLSLENPTLDAAVKRELVDRLEKLQNELRDKKSKMTKSRVYKKHTELLRTIPGIDKKVWHLYKQKKFPDEVQTAITAPVRRLYEPTDLDIDRAEGWTHRCQTFKSYNDPVPVKHEIGEYVIAGKDFAELSVEYEIRMNIEGRCFSSAAHYILFCFLTTVLTSKFDRQTAETKSEHALLGVTGKFIGVEKGTDIFIKVRDEMCELLLRKTCEKGIAAWLKSSPVVRDALRKQTGEILYRNSNPVLGTGPLGSEVEGLNLVGTTLTRMRKIV